MVTMTLSPPPTSTTPNETLTVTPKPLNQVTSQVISETTSNCISLEEYLKNPPERMEWINGNLVEKNGMTLRHGKIQFRLALALENYKNNQQLGGEVYTEVPCRTVKQGRSPDVAYLTPELVEKYGNESSLPQSFPFCAEIISPTDLAENVLLKAREYLESSGEEVWLVYPESKWVMVLTSDQAMMYGSKQTAKTEKILSGFTIALDDLLA
jgi:Uma2 family endonuclease